MFDKIALSFPVLTLWGMAIAFTSTVHAGVIRDDQSDSLYTGLAADAEYSGVGALLYSIGSDDYICSGTVIAANWILTAAHCVNDSNTTNMRFNVGGTTYNNGTTYWATNRYFHEDWNSTNPWGGSDIALVQFASAITGVTIAELYTGTADLYKVGTNVGYGASGIGTYGTDGTGSSSPGTKRAGNNVIDALAGSGTILLQDFDEPGDQSESWFGSRFPLDLEYLIAGGDSGGGLFIEEGGTTYLAGVHSFTSWVDEAGDSDYGDISGSTRVSSFVGWIDAKINPVSLPGTLTLMWLGLAVLGFRVRT